MSNSNGQYVNLHSAITKPATPIVINSAPLNGSGWNHKRINNAMNIKLDPINIPSAERLAAWNIIIGANMKNINVRLMTGILYNAYADIQINTNKFTNRANIFAVQMFVSNSIAALIPMA